MSKAKITGWVGGRQVADYYASKRRLLRPGIALRKLGKIGDFWLKNRETLWEEIQAREKRIGEGRVRPHVRLVAEHLYEMLDRSVSLGKLERFLAFNADEPFVAEWASRLDGGWQEALDADHTTPPD